MISIPPRHYCVIDNPAIKDERGVVLDKNGQVRLRHGEQEVRLTQDPFSLFPGERLNGTVSTLQIVPANTALRLRATSQTEDHEGNERMAGDEWLFKGPATYYPNVNVKVIELIKSHVLLPDEALLIQATQDFVDDEGRERKTGEKWLAQPKGAYLPHVHEQILDTVSPILLNEKTALHLRATTGFTDKYGNDRIAGEEWLLTNKTCELHVPDVYEEIIRTVNIISLTKRQYVIIHDPVDKATGANLLGERKLVVGPKNFFLRPGESLEGNNIKQIEILMAEQALVIKAEETFVETVGGKQITRKPGDKWTVYGPREYVPPLGAQIWRRQTALIALENQNIYIFNPFPFLIAVVLLLLAYYWFFVRSVVPLADDAAPEAEL
eukprot:CAMPEP_0174257670 /NCGR_PEP_ID=MMETSP0439-20130205/6780_1 /TAXON_ID=0 /ORGANISM="Stereomyxa ramosa, Strain Chinc5" /LENGTH=380 /DNA_ID=CAMNT_0015340861 /DNA_START=365 /DNA_END=1507 /DNA_ORIENTATION=+